jgi:hypothetical protein
MIATKGDKDLSKLIVEAIEHAPLIKVERGSLPNSYVEVPKDPLSSMVA